MVKIISWNVNSINVRLERLLGLLDREHPDFVCLQELKCSDDKFPFAAVQARGYHASVHGQKTYNGVAVLSKSPPELVSKGFASAALGEQARLISVRQNDLTVISAYVPNGQAVGSEKYSYKLNWLDQLTLHMRSSFGAADKVILAGDFNIAPGDLDVHDPDAWREQILCSSAERERLTSIMQAGYHDVLRDLSGQERHYSWWDYRMLAFQKNLGLRIDLILASAAMRAGLISCRIDRDERKGEKPSDHAPVIAVFQ